MREGNYITIHCDGKKYLLRYSLEWILEKLPQNIFTRVHRSFVVNLRLVTKYTPQYLFIENNQIPISRLYKKDVQEKMYNLI